MNMINLAAGTAIIYLKSKKSLNITVKSNCQEIKVNDLVGFTLDCTNYSAKVIEVLSEDKIISGLQFKPNDFIIEVKGDFSKMDTNLFKPKLEIFK